MHSEFQKPDLWMIQMHELLFSHNMKPHCNDRKCTTAKAFQNKLANDNEHGIKVSQNNLQCKYTTYALKKKQEKSKAFLWLLFNPYTECFLVPWL